MGAEIQTIEVRSNNRIEMIDITRRVKEIVASSGVREGVCHLFVPHTTAALAINENADPSVQRDIEGVLSKLVPVSAAYAHTEGNADAHVKSVLFGPSLTVFVRAGDLVLGTWQGIFFCEFDGPRWRKVMVKVVSD